MRILKLKRSFLRQWGDFPIIQGPGSPGPAHTSLTPTLYCLTRGMPVTHAPHTSKCMAVRSTGQHDHCSSVTGLLSRTGCRLDQRKRDVNRRRDERKSSTGQAKAWSLRAASSQAPHPGLRSCTLSTFRPWGSQSRSSNFAYIQTCLLLLAPTCPSEVNRRGSHHHKALQEAGTLHEGLAPSHL